LSYRPNISRNFRFRDTTAFKMQYG